MSTPEFTSAHTTKFTETVQTAMLMRLGLVDAGPVSHPDILPDEPPTLLGVATDRHKIDDSKPHIYDDMPSPSVQLVLAHAETKTYTPKKRSSRKGKSSKSVTTENIAELIQKSRIQRSPDAIVGAVYPCGDVDPDLFYPKNKTDKLIIAASKTICSSCIAVEQCGKQAIDDEETFGTWGGMTQWERKELLQKRAVVEAKQQL